ncbi:MAG: potassium transporter TrkA [Gemmatimonadetes bacterium]|nr:potassium transporter TrkA [Gemmatimonadota bacterium]
MKTLVSQLSYFLQKRTSQRNLKLLVRLFFVFLGIVALFSVLFHFLMQREGHEHTWITGFYWTLTVMSTLGFGDITFHTDLGRAFSVIVLLTGILYMLVLFPFTFIQFFYAPWMEAQSEIRAPRQLPASTRSHVLITNYDTVTQALISKLESYQIPYHLIVPDLAEALRLYDLGVRVVVGELDDPETYRRMRVDQAALVAATNTDAANTNVAFTVRELAPNVPIVTTANDSASVDILELAGGSRVLQLDQMLGESLARRTLCSDVRAHMIGQYGGLFIAEASASGTSMVGQTLASIGLRSELGVTVVGVWERGVFQAARFETVIGINTILVLAATAEQLDQFNERYRAEGISDSPVIIIGAGRVGRAAALALAARGVDYRIVDQDSEPALDKDKHIVGNAAELEVLKKAGIMEAPTVIITTHEDDTNVYLALYCRRLHADIQIISRVTLERNISTLHRAGADFVMSYASMGAGAIFNFLEGGDMLMIAEGLGVFKVKIPKSLAGRSIEDNRIRRRTGCTVIALKTGPDQQINPDPHEPLPDEGELILIGSTDGESRFIDSFYT